MPLPATRAAAWPLRPVPALAKPGCWSRACCGHCWKAMARAQTSSHTKYWLLPSPKRPQAKCASACTSGLSSLPMQTTTPCGKRCWCAVLIPAYSIKSSIKTARTAAKTYACCSQIYTSGCLPTGARFRSELFTAGLPPCCAAHPWRPYSNWVCRSTMSCWKTMARPKHWSGGGFMRHWCRTTR